MPSPFPGLRGRSAAVAAAASGLLVLTGCGSADQAAAPAPAASAPTSAAPSGTAPSGTAPSAPADAGLTPVQLVSRSSEAAGKAGSARIALSSVIEVAGRTQRIEGSGLVDTRTQASSLQVSLPGGNGTVETRSVGGTTYVRGVPGAPAGKWVTAPAAAAQTGGTTDPTQLLSMLKKVSDDVHADGSKQIRGVRTTRYTGTLDLGKAVEQQGGASSDQAQQMLDQLGVDEVPFVVFLDGEGRPARYSMDLRLEAAGKAVRSSTTVDFYDWGTPVDVTAPDASDVVQGGVPAPTATTS